jgi:hypothetical protein
MQLRLTPLALILQGMLVALPAFAQDPLDDVYGHAVHAYFRGDVARAQELLNQVIDAGSTDPRAFYFRGLAQAALGGDTMAGMSDFEKAADLEINGQKVVNVGKALERIQGAARCAIESIRRDTRLASRDKYLQLQRMRYEESRRAAPLVPSRAPDAPPTPVPAANDPFAPGTDLNKGAPVPMPGAKTPTTPPAADDPFGDAPGDANKDGAPAADDPFGGAAPASSDDPFGN